MNSPPESSMRDRLRARREARRQSVQPPPESARWLEAAAVLVDFHPDELRASIPAGIDGPFSSDPAAALANSSITLVKNGHERWTLRPDTRNATLRAMGGRPAILSALDVAPAPDTVEQRIYASILRGKWDWVQFDSVDRLAAALQAALWLDGVLTDLPDASELRRRLGRARFLAPFEQLAATDFVGRTAELQKLNDFVGIRELSSPSEQIAAVFRGSVIRAKKGPLVLYGPGGAGKSSLMARFILDQESASLAFRKFPIVYLDFDNSTLRLGDPRTLLVEAARQLALQYPAMESKALAAAEAAAQAEPDTAPARADADAAAVELFQRGVAFWDEWLPRFGLASDRPFLLVFDTFEEVPPRNKLAVSQIFHLIERIERIHPMTRAVVAGRALDQTFGADMERAFDSVPIGEFDPSSAASFLMRKGVGDPELARAIVSQVGGTPLSLKLAAEVLARGEEADARTGLKDLRTRSWLMFSANETVIQGQLYQRILAHIRNPELRKLAHPGLILRRVTPDLIAEVLAGPCKLDMPAEPGQRAVRAASLFDELRQVAFLVEPRGVNALRHRADIRRVMLSLLEKDRPADVAAVHRAAAEYYRGKGTTAEERAEEIYHRLKLDEDPEEVGKRWIPDAGKFLEDALVELSPRAQAMVASRAHLRIQDESTVYAGAGLDAWERWTDRRITEGLTGVPDYPRLLAMLAERKERTAASPLYLAEARVHRAMRKPHLAIAALRAGADAMASSGDRPALLTHLAVLSGVLREAARWEEAMRTTRDAARLAIELGDWHATDDMLEAWYGISVSASRPDWNREAQAMLAAALEKLPASEWTAPAHRLWIKSGIAWAGPSNPNLMIRALENSILPLAPDVRSVLVEVIREAPGNAKLMDKIADLFAQKGTGSGY